MCSKTQQFMLYSMLLEFLRKKWSDLAPTVKVLNSICPNLVFCERMMLSLQYVVPSRTSVSFQATTESIAGIKFLSQFCHLSAAAVLCIIMWRVHMPDIINLLSWFDYPSPQGLALQAQLDYVSGICGGSGHCRTAVCCPHGEASH